MPRPDSRNLSSREMLKRIALEAELCEHEAEFGVPESADRDLAEALRARARSLAECHAFQPGELVTWKSGLRNRSYPRHGRPAVVIAVLREPVLDTERDSGSTYFREPLDLVLGLFADQGNFLVWHFDSRRFQPWVPVE